MPQQLQVLTLAVVLSTICASSRQMRQNMTPVRGLGNATYRLSYRNDLPPLPAKQMHHIHQNLSRSVSTNMLC